MKRILKYAPIVVSVFMSFIAFCVPDIHEPLDTMMPFGTISGIVTDRAGSKLAGVNVRVEVNGQSCVTNAEGEFTLNGVPSGTHRLFFVRAGYRDTSIAGVTVGNGQNQVLSKPVVMRLATAVIKGMVLSNGVAKAGVGVAVVNQPVASLTGVGGTFVLSGVQADSSVLIAADGTVGYCQQKVTLTPGETLNVSMAITASKDGGTVTGIVFNDAGNPQAGVVVSAVGDGIRDTTKADGSYALKNVPVNVPLEVSSSNGARVGGVTVDAKGMLTNINVSPPVIIGSGPVTIKNGTYIVPLGKAVTVTAVFTGGNAAAWFLWDIDNNSTYDTITSTPTLSLSGSDKSRVIGFGVATISGDTVSGGRITITPVSARPTASAIPADTTIKRRQALRLIGQADCRTGGIMRFAWDFDGNGIVDWMRPDGGTVTHRYNSAGKFYSILTVTGTNGESHSDTAIVIVSADSVAVADSELIAPTITNLHPFDTVPPFLHVILEPLPPQAVVYALLIGQHGLDSLVVGYPQMYMIPLDRLSEGSWYLQPAAIKGNDTAWGDIIMIVVQRQPPELTLFSPVGGATVGGDSVWLRWEGWSYSSLPGMLKFNVRLDDNFPPGVDYAHGLTFSSSLCSLRVAPAGGWNDSTIYYWEITAIDSADTVSVIDSFLYVVSGASGIDTIWGGSIVPGPALSVVRILPLVVTCSDGSIAVIGGHDAAWNVLNTADILAPGATSFTTVPMNFPHDGGAIARMKNGRYILAGSAGILGTAGSSGNTVEMFDPVSKAFTPLSPMTYERTSPAMATLANGMVLVVGGWYNDNAAIYGDLYNPTAGIFTSTPAMYYPRSRPLVIPCADTTALIIGGLPTRGGPIYETIEQFSPATNEFTMFSHSFIEKDSGWLPFYYDYYMCDLAAQKDAQGRYILMASRGNQFALVSVDPVTKVRDLLATNPPLPAADSVIFFKAPLVDAATNVAYLLAKDLATQNKLRLYRVDLTSRSLTEPKGWLTPGGTFGFSFPAAALMPDGKIFVCGGTPDGWYYNGTNNTWVITPN